jgi:hypothetical protein
MIDPNATQLNGMYVHDVTGAASTWTPQGNVVINFVISFSIASRTKLMRVRTTTINGRLV